MKGEFARATAASARSKQRWVTRTAARNGSAAVAANPADSAGAADPRGAAWWLEAARLRPGGRAAMPAAWRKFEALARLEPLEPPRDQWTQSDQGAAVALLATPPNDDASDGSGGGCDWARLQRDWLEWGRARQPTHGGRIKRALD